MEKKMIMLLTMFIIFSIGCAGTEVDVSDLVTTQLTCAHKDGDEPFYNKCVSNSKSPIHIRYCLGPTKKVIDENNGSYFCWGNPQSVNLILLDSINQWNFPVGVPSPKVSWTLDQKIIYSSDWNKHKYLYPFFVWE